MALQDLLTDNLDRDPDRRIGRFPRRATDDTERAFAERLVEIVFLLLGWWDGWGWVGSERGRRGEREGREERTVRSGLPR